MSNVVKLKSKTSGLYSKGKLHAEGGIPVIVDNVKPIEVEVKEFLMCNKFLENDKVYEFKDKTNLEVLEAIFQDSNCFFDSTKANSNDFILCRLVVLDKTRHPLRTGTAKDILNAMQAEKSCRVSTDYSPDAVKRKLGGSITSDNEANSLRDVIELMEEKLKDNPNDIATKETIELLKETLAEKDAERNTHVAWFKFDKEDPFKKGYFRIVWTEKLHIPVPSKGIFLDSFKNVIKEVPYYKVEELQEKGRLLTEKEYKDYAGEKEFEVKYVAKDRMKLSGKMKGSIKTWITAKNKDDVEKKLKNKREFSDFGELISIKSTGLKFAEGGNVGEEKNEMKVNITNIDLSALFFADKRGGLIYPIVETVDLNNYYLPVTKSVILIFSAVSKKNNDFIHMSDVIGAVIPDVNYIKDIILKHEIPFAIYDSSASNDKEEKFNAIKKLSRTHAEIIVD